MTPIPEDGPTEAEIAEAFFNVERLYVAEGEPNEQPHYVRVLATAYRREKARADELENPLELADYQPCGCVPCKCEGPQCLGCGSKVCVLWKTPNHPQWVFKKHPLVIRAEKAEIALAEVQRERDALKEYVESLETQIRRSI